jgi:peptide/nickel transport system substrate-binding protein
MVPRRTLLRQVGIGIAAVSGTALLAACGATTTPAGAPTTAPAAPAPTTAPAAAPTAAPTTAAAAAATTAPAAAPTAAPTAAPAVAAGGKRGAAGTLKMLLWQGPTVLNPHIAVGTKDSIVARLVLEPLISAKNDGTLVPILVTEIPTTANGGLSADLTSVTYKLKPGIKWADGEPLTADDVVFTWQFVTDKETAATTLGTYRTIDTATAVDATTVKITFKDPNPGWFVPFLGTNGMVLPKHALKDYIGAKAKDAPWNQKPIGTGPYKVDQFASGDLVVYSINDNYREPDKPAFKRVEIKGGGDAPSAARAVLQTGDYDYAWNLQVEWPVLQSILAGGKGDLLTAPGSGVEQVRFNLTDPNKEVDGEKSKLGNPHPILADIKVRQALSMAMDRDTMAKQLYGDTGAPTPNLLTTPTNFLSSTPLAPFDLAQAGKLLDDAGWVKGSDGMRAKGGVPLKLTLQTSVNSLRQKEQEVIKQGFQKLGVDLTLKSVPATVFFGQDNNPDNVSHFYTDLEMFTSTFTSPNPASYMNSWYSGNPAKDIPQKANSWSGNNYCRFQSDDFNKLYDDAAKQTDPQKLIDDYKKMNDMVVSQAVTVGLIDRKFADAKLKNLQGPQILAFDIFSWNIADWTRS